jgi:single-strand DNA-binding protein
MGSLNRVILCGNIGNDPELRAVAGGGRVATMSLATSQKWTGANGARQEETQWHKLICWNGKTKKLADVCERMVKKGDRLLIEGTIKYRKWQDKEGSTRYSTEIHVSDLVLLGHGPKGDGSTPATKPRERAPGEDLEDAPDVLPPDDDDLPF